TKDIVVLGEQVVWSELKLLRDAYKASMYFDYLGRLRFHSPLEIGWREPDTEWTFVADPSHPLDVNSSRITGKIRRTYNQISCNRAKSNLNLFEQRSKRVIYRDTTNWNSDLSQCSIIVEPGHTYPEAGVLSLSYKDPSTGEEYPYAINVQTPTVGQSKTYDICYSGGRLAIVSFNGSSEETTQQPNASQIILKNTGALSCEILKFEIKGEPFLQLSENEVEEVDASVSDDVDYVDLSVDGKYASSVDQIDKVLARHVEEGKIRTRHFSFSTIFLPQIQREMRCNFVDSDGSVVQCKITTYSHKQSGRTLDSMRTNVELDELLEYEPTYNPHIIVKNPSASVPSPGNPGDKVIIQFALGNETGPFDTGWTLGQDDWEIGQDDWVIGQDSWLYDPPVPGEGQYVWKRVGYYNPSTDSWPSNWTITRDTGLSGSDGVGVTSITPHYAISTSSTTAPTSGWSDTVPARASNEYLWQYETILYSNSTSFDTEKRVVSGIDGDPGQNGVSITGVASEYAVNTSSTTAPTDGWSQTRPTRGTGEILWTRERIEYSVGADSVTTPRPVTGDVGDTGAAGTSVTSIIPHYAVSTSGTIAPASGWTTTVPSKLPSQYMWQYETINYSNIPSVNTSPRVVSGIDGSDGADGISVTSVVTQFAVNTSSSTAPTSGWSSSQPIRSAGQYLWAREEVSYSSGSPVYNTPRMITGDKGDIGDTGAPGLSVAELSIYQRASSAPEAPTGGSYDFGAKTLTPPAGWSTDVPAGANPCYISKAVASVQGTTGTVSVNGWTTPQIAFQNGTDGEDGTDGQSATYIFRRSATQPATPAVSAGIPTGWYDNPGSVPAGSDAIWASYGTRPTATGNWTWHTPIIIEGKDGETARAINVYADSSVISLSSRGELKTQEIIITCLPSNLPIGSAVWTATDAGSLSQVEIAPGVYDQYRRSLDCSMVAGDSTLITVSIEYGGVTYTGVAGISKVADGIPTPYNFHGVTEVPVTSPVGPLIVGDYFLWSAETSGGYTKGQIYEYNGSGWVVSANGDLVMTLFDSFADIANDVESTVMGLAVAKKLVAIKAWIEDLTAQYL
ncbi:MAG: hypothetical protein ACQ5SW_04590, partial [Sphaerochaetaceae bacterium]